MESIIESIQKQRRGRSRFGQPPKPDLGPIPTLEQLINPIARAHVMHVLEVTNGNITRASEVLGIGRHRLYRMLDRWSKPAVESREAEQVAGVSSGAKG